MPVAYALKVGVKGLSPRSLTGGESLPSLRTLHEAKLR